MITNKKNIDIHELLQGLLNKEEDEMKAADIAQLHNMNNRVITINDDVDEYLARDIINQLLYLDSISNETITVYVNTPGGIVTSGLAIYDIMRVIKSDVKTIATGIAASMGSIILVGGEKGQRFATPNAEIMIHSVSGGARGNVDEIEVTTKNIKKTNDRLIQILHQATGQSLKKLKKDTSKDFFLTAEEALKYGLIDKVITSLE